MRHKESFIDKKLNERRAELDSALRVIFEPQFGPEWDKLRRDHRLRKLFRAVAITQATETRNEALNQLVSVLRRYREFDRLLKVYYANRNRSDMGSSNDSADSIRKRLTLTSSASTGDSVVGDSRESHLRLRT